MKIDRLLAIVLHLLNNEMTSARELAGKFGVSQRTIQRDIDSLCSAGIPVVSSLGARGGFGIMPGYSINRQMVDTDDLFFIITSLESIYSTFENGALADTIEKMRAIAGKTDKHKFEKKKEKLYIDFSSLHIGRKNSNNQGLIENAIDNCRVISFKYTSSRGKRTVRNVEPYTIVFKWYSWYLFGWCRLRNDYRLFRLSRIKDAADTGERFFRKEVDFEEHQNKYRERFGDIPLIKLKFIPEMKYIVEEYFRDSSQDILEDGSILMSVKIPEDYWLYGMILSYGDAVEVIEPVHIREIIKNIAGKIQEKY